MVRLCTTSLAYLCWSTAFLLQHSVQRIFFYIELFLFLPTCRSLIATFLLDTPFSGLFFIELFLFKPPPFILNCRSLINALSLRMANAASAAAENGEMAAAPVSSVNTQTDELKRRDAQTQKSGSVEVRVCLRAVRLSNTSL